jgi:hypothetical protein
MRHEITNFAIQASGVPGVFLAEPPLAVVWRQSCVAPIVPRKTRLRGAARRQTTATRRIEVA